MEDKPKVEFVNDRDSSQPEFLRNLLIPLSKRGWPKWLVYALGLLGIGNLDEGLAFMLLLTGLVEFFDGKKRQH